MKNTEHRHEETESRENRLTRIRGAQECQCLMHRGIDPLVGAAKCLSVGSIGTGALKPIHDQLLKARHGVSKHRLEWQDSDGGRCLFQCHLPM